MNSVSPEYGRPEADQHRYRGRLGAAPGVHEVSSLEHGDRGRRCSRLGFHQDQHRRSGWRDGRSNRVGLDQNQAPGRRVRYRFGAGARSHQDPCSGGSGRSGRGFRPVHAVQRHPRHSEQYRRGSPVGRRQISGYRPGRQHPDRSERLPGQGKYLGGGYRNR